MPEFRRPILLSGSGPLGLDASTHWLPCADPESLGLFVYFMLDSGVLPEVEVPTWSPWHNSSAPRILTKCGAFNFKRGIVDYSLEFKLAGADEVVMLWPILDFIDQVLILAKWMLPENRKISLSFWHSAACTPKYLRVFLSGVAHRRGVQHASMILDCGLKTSSELKGTAYPRYSLPLSVNGSPASISNTISSCLRSAMVDLENYLSQQNDVPSAVRALIFAHVVFITVIRFRAPLVDMDEFPLLAELIADTLNLLSGTEGALKIQNFSKKLPELNTYNIVLGTAIFLVIGKLLISQRK